VAACLVLLTAVVAVVVDGGMLLHERRHAQAVADAVALAAADRLYANYGTDQGTDPHGKAAQAAQDTASANGYTDGDGTHTVAVNIPPGSGPYTDSSKYPGYAEVIVTANEDRFFSGIFALFGAGNGKLPVKARAVARGQWVASSGGILVLDPTAYGALSSNGNGNVTVKNADIIVNSNNSTAAYTNGNAFVSDYNGTPGNINITGKSPGYSGRFTGNVSTGILPTLDPLAYLPAPNYATMATGSTTTASNGTITMTAGYYSSSVSFSSNSNVTMSPGVYYINGNFSWSGNSTLTATGVTIYCTGSLSITGNGTVNWSAPTSGTYAGVAYFQARSSTATSKIAGNGSYNITGTFYNPAGLTQIQGNGDASLSGQMITDQLSAGGNGSMNINYIANDVARTRIINLVE
jgi:hypothetical protein